MSEAAQRRAGRRPSPSPTRTWRRCRSVAVATKELVEMLAGQRGEAHDVAVTWGDLLDLGFDQTGTGADRHWITSSSTTTSWARRWPLACRHRTSTRSRASISAGSGTGVSSRRGDLFELHRRVDRHAFGGWDPHWINRDMLYVVFDYPFNQLGVKRLFGLGAGGQPACPEIQ